MYAVKGVSWLTGSDEDKPSSLNFFSLEKRRQQCDMIETFKLIHNFEDVDASKFFILVIQHPQPCNKKDCFSLEQYC